MRPPMGEWRWTSEHFDADEGALVTDRAKARRKHAGQALQGRVGLGLGLGFAGLAEGEATPSE